MVGVEFCGETCASMALAQAYMILGPLRRGLGKGLVQFHNATSFQSIQLSIGGPEQDFKGAVLQ